MLGKFFSKKKDKEEKVDPQPNPEAPPEGKKKIVIKRRTGSNVPTPRTHIPIVDEEEQEDFIEETPVQEQQAPSIQEAEPILEPVPTVEEEQFEENRKELEQRIEQFQVEKEQLEQSQASALALVQKLNDEKEEFVALVQSLQNENTRLQAAAQNQDLTPSESTEELSELRAKISQLKVEKQAILSAKSSLEQAQESAVQQIETLQAQKIQLIESQDPNSGTNQQALLELQDEITKGQEKLSNLQAQIIDFKADKKTWLDEKERLDAAERANKLLLDSLEKEKNEFQSNLELGTANFSSNKEKMQIEISGLQEKNTDLQQELRKLQADKSKIEAERNSLGREHDATGKIIASLEQEKSNLANSLKLSESDLLTTKNKLTDAAAKFKADKSQFQLKFKAKEKEHNFAAKKVEFLEDEKSQLLQNVQDLEEEVAEYEKKVKSVTKEMEVYKVENEQFVITNKALYKENEELEKELAKIEKHRDKLRMSLDRMEDNVKENNLKMAVSENDMSQLLENRRTAENFSQKLVQELETSQDQVTALTKELATAQGQVESHQQQLDAAIKAQDSKHQLALHRVKSDLENTHMRAILEVKATIKDWQNKNDKLTNQNQALTLQLAKKAQQLKQPKTTPPEEIKPEKAPQTTTPEPEEDTEATNMLETAANLNLVVQVMPENDEYDVELPSFADGDQVVNGFIEAGVLRQNVRYKVNIKRTNHPVANNKTLGECGATEGDTIVITPY